MGLSAGTGSPVYFVCPAYRRTYWKTRTQREAAWHKITLTGRKRLNRSKGHAMGVRSDYWAREYVCRCGHRGWSNHMDLAAKAGEKFRDLESLP